MWQRLEVLLLLNDGWRRLPLVLGHLKDSCLRLGQVLHQDHSLLNIVFSDGILFGVFSVLHTDSFARLDTLVDCADKGLELLVTSFHWFTKNVAWLDVWWHPGHCHLFTIIELVL